MRDPNNETVEAFRHSRRRTTKSADTSAHSERVRDLCHPCFNRPNPSYNIKGVTPSESLEPPREMMNSHALVLVRPPAGIDSGIVHRSLDDPIYNGEGKGSMVGCLHALNYKKR